MWRRLLALGLGLGVVGGLFGAAEVRQRGREGGRMAVVTDPPGMKYAFGAEHHEPRGWQEGMAPKPKRAGIWRVLCVGDSVTYGVHVAPNEAWPAQLQRLIPDAEVHNLGVTGYDAEQVAALVSSRLLAWKPDLVVWLSYVNDLSPTQMLYGTDTGDAIFVGTTVPDGAQIVPDPLARWLLARSALFRNIQGVVYNRYLAAHPQQEPEQGWYQQQVAALVAWSATNHVPLVVGAAPPHVMATPDACSKLMSDPTFCPSNAERYRVILDTLRSNGLDPMDGAAAWAQTGAPHFFPPSVNDPDHPNAAGHAALARAFAPYVRAALDAQKPEPSEIKYRRKPPNRME